MIIIYIYYKHLSYRIPFNYKLYGIGGIPVIFRYVVLLTQFYQSDK